MGGDAYTYTARPNRKKRDAHNTHAARERGRTSRTQTDTIHGTLPLTTSTSHPRPVDSAALTGGHASDHIILSTVAKTLRLERLPTETRHASKFASTRARASRGRRGPSPRAYESSARSPHTRLSLLPPRSRARSRARRRRRGAPPHGAPPWSARMPRRSAPIPVHRPCSCTNTHSTKDGHAQTSPEDPWRWSPRRSD